MPGGYGLLPRGGHWIGWGGLTSAQAAPLQSQLADRRRFRVTELVELFGCHRGDHISLQERRDSRQKRSKLPQVLSYRECIEATLFCNRVLDQRCSVLSGAPENEVGINQVLRLHSPQCSDLLREECSSVFETHTLDDAGLPEEGGRLSDEIDLEGRVVTDEAVSLKVFSGFRRIEFDLESHTVGPANKLVPVLFHGVKLPAEEIEVVGPAVLKVGKRECRTTG